MPRLPVLLAVALGLLPVAGACGSSAVGVDACKSIEEARCNQIPNCPNVQAEISPPLWYTTGTATEACIRYYDTACLHGLSVGVNPASSDVTNCIEAIDSNCATVAQPQTDPACAWLVPPTVEDDAGDGGDGGDSDAADAADTAEAAEE